MRKQELIVENASLRGLLLELRALIDDALDSDAVDPDEDTGGEEEDAEEELDDSED